MFVSHRTLKFYAYLAVVVLLGAAIGLLRPSPALSDVDLRQAVNSAFIPRTEDPALHELAHQRAVEASVNFSHEGMDPCCGEVLAWNQGFADPVSMVVQQWIDSPAHNALLSDPSFTSIGCGSVTTSDGRYVAACLLGSSTDQPVAEPAQMPVSPQVTPAPTPAPATLLPNTAIGEP